MKKTLLNLTFILKRIAVLAVLLGFMNNSFGQNPTASKNTTPKAQQATAKKKIAGKPKSTAPVSALQSVKLDTTSINAYTSESTVGSDQFSQVVLKFIVDGNTPSADLPVA
ncbi:MAG: hypothetical protein ACXVIY_13165, partial [Mucilaginibacter sp.]